MTQYTQTFCADIVAQGLKLGASDVACTLKHHKATTAEAYDKKPQGISVNTSASLQLDVYLGQQRAQLTSTDLSAEGISNTLALAMQMAQSAAADPYVGLAEKELYSPKAIPTFKPDASPMTAAQMAERASVLEGAIRRVDGISAVRTVHVSYDLQHTVKVNSRGFSSEYTKSHSTYAGVGIGESGEIKTTYLDSHSVPHAKDLPDIEVFGKEIGREAAARLKQGKLQHSGVMPVLLSPRISTALLVNNLADSLDALTITEGKSWLKLESAGQQIAAPQLALTDHWNLLNGLGSRLFDGEGIAGPEELKLLDKGTLAHLMVGLRGARKAGLTANGRGQSSNLWLANGTTTVKDLLGDIQDGFYVTELMGRGFSLLTGDFSYPMGGYLIHKGEITDTFVIAAAIAGNLKDLLMNATPANDLVMKYATNAPTLRVEGLTVSGA